MVTANHLCSSLNDFIVFMILYIAVICVFTKTAWMMVHRSFKKEWEGRGISIFLIIVGVLLITKNPTGPI